MNRKRAQCFLQPLNVSNVPNTQAEYPGPGVTLLGTHGAPGVAVMGSKERTAGVDGTDGAMAGFRVGEGPDSYMQGIRGQQSQGV